ncbi:hypothetical protein Vretimale_4207 [Volvox reticuliferus]|uniref:Tetrahydrofolate dehydrogenase/cyclohydrolase NAD(P)-binding domain-containing protein n=1 Tax=Volvox reticuliferus TaxID=1737510 RepID=A0A8J4DF49_9CHLO|nr:hypothetical protein Vretimale_4207 [Volvox reticuliferus]
MYSPRQRMYTARMRHDTRLKWGLMMLKGAIRPRGRRLLRNEDFPTYLRRITIGSCYAAKALPIWLDGFHVALLFRLEELWTMGPCLRLDSQVHSLCPMSLRRMLMRGRGVRLVPATPLGCIELLQRSGVEIQGKTCVVLGDSNIVGTPLAAMLRDKGAAAVTICHRRSYREWFEDQEQVQRTRAAAAVCLPPLPGPSRPPPPDLLLPLATAAPAEGGRLGGEASANEGFQSYQLPYLTRSADILVVAVGHPELVRGDWVRPGAVVIDVGINVVSTLPRSRSSSTPETEATTDAIESDADAVAAAAAPEGESSGAGGVHVAVTAFADRARGCSVGGYGGSCNSSRSGSFGVGGSGGNGGSAYGKHGASTSNPSHVVNGSSGGWVATANGCSLHSGRNVTFQVVGDVAFEEVSQVGESPSFLHVVKVVLIQDICTSWRIR